MNVGDRVRIERDETRHPSRGTWPWFRGKTGTVVEINRDRKRPHLTEYGVVQALRTIHVGLCAPRGATGERGMTNQPQNHLSQLFAALEEGLRQTTGATPPDERGEEFARFMAEHLGR